MKQRWTWGEISCRFLLGFVFFLVRKKGGVDFETPLEISCDTDNCARAFFCWVEC